MSEFRYIVGIDEAGRGPLAGPVAVGAVVMTAEFYEQYKAWPIGIVRAGKLIRPKEAEQNRESSNRDYRIPVGKDSKKMTEREREFWFQHLKGFNSEQVRHTVALVSNNNIDAIGIVEAIRSGLSGCLEKLEIDPTSSLILLDGGLKAPQAYKFQQTIISGDEKEPIIGLGSIAAKVTRDNHMLKQAETYPQYGFDQHVGYGTKLHYEMLKKHGPCPIHRKSFIHAAIDKDTEMGH